MHISSVISAVANNTFTSSDVQSLHNRVLTLESQIAQLATQAYSAQPSPNNLQARSFLNDRTIVATGASGSSIIISLDDVAGIWLEALDISDIDDRVVLTPQQPSLPAGAANPRVYTNIDFTAFHIPGTFADPNGGLGVTSALVQMLPQNPMIRDELLKQLEVTLALHPIINFLDFKGHILDLYKYAAAASGKQFTSATSNPISSGKSAAARARSASTSVPVTKPDDMDANRPSTSTGLPIRRPSLSFFSSAAAAFALSARILANASATPTGSDASGTNQNTSGPERPSTVGVSSLPSHQQCVTTGLASNLNSMNLQGGLGLISKGATGNPPPSVNSSGYTSNQGASANPFETPGCIGAHTIHTAGSRPPTRHSHTSPHSQSTTSPAPPSPPNGVHSLPTPSSLFSLSLHSLTMHELSAGYDLDYLIAMLLQVLFLLYDNGGLRNPSVPQILFPMVGKMVNVARMMGLYIDPADVGSNGDRYGLFESEMRRRLWWDIYYYDL